MSSNGCSDDLRLDLDRDLTTTPDDVCTLRALRAQASSWLDLSPDELDALLPAAALDRRPAAPPNRPPFTLE